MCIDSNIKWLRNLIGEIFHNSEMFYRCKKTFRIEKRNKDLSKEFYERSFMQHARKIHIDKLYFSYIEYNLTRVIER